MILLLFEMKIKNFHEKDCDLHLTISISSIIVSFFDFVLSISFSWNCNFSDIWIMLNKLTVQSFSFWFWWCSLDSRIGFITITYLTYLSTHLRYFLRRPFIFTVVFFCARIYMKSVVWYIIMWQLLSIITILNSFLLLWEIKSLSFKVLWLWTNIIFL